MKHFDPIPQTAYLTAVNASQYRTIMRIFYLENEKMRFKLYKEDVYDRLMQESGFESYTMDQLKLDLAMLVTWKNLMPIQDPRRVYSIEDYKNKQFQYSMSEYAMEVERMTLRLENLFMEGGNLSSHYFIRILQGVEQAERMLSLPLKEVNQWWRSLQEDFTILNQNYKDYLREFYSGQSEKMMKSMEFLIHKDRFVSYLREFVRELQVYSGKIGIRLTEFGEENKSRLLERVVDSELEIPRNVSEQADDFKMQIRERIPGQWNTLESWFCRSAARMSESDMVLEVTNEIIRKVIQNAAMILQMQGWGMNRKEDYRQFIRMFQNCTDISEAHCLAALTFGVFQIEHFKINGQRLTDSINSSVYEEEPMEFPLTPRTNKYRPRTDKTGFESRTFERMARRQAYLDMASQERDMVLKYKKGNRLELASITDVIPTSVRSTLLRWIAAANTTENRTGLTEFGQAFTLVQESGRMTLSCEDGDLEMPCYVLVFEEEK